MAIFAGNMMINPLFEGGGYCHREYFSFKLILGGSNMIDMTYMTNVETYVRTPSAMKCSW